MNSLPDEVKSLQSILSPDQQYFLVGGVVRDAILGCENHDIDIVCSVDPHRAARQFADKIGGAFYVMDEKRKICRVIGSHANVEKSIFDFVPMRGDSINTDLLERDFTINAIALDLFHPAEMIDPLSGVKDLDDRLLRICKPSSIAEDPLRVVRAIRYANKYGLQITIETLQQIEIFKKSLDDISAERKRDELFKIMENANVARAVEWMHRLGLLTALHLPITNCQSGVFRTMQTIEKMMNGLITGVVNPDDSDLLLPFVSEFSPFRNAIRGLLKLLNDSDRSLQSLIYLIALLWNLEEGSSIHFIDGLALSRQEQERMKSVLQSKNLIKEILGSNEQLDDRQIYRYYLQCGVSGVELVLLGLADLFPDPLIKKDFSSWKKALACGKTLYEAWFMRPQVINPPTVITGRDLLFEFDLPQGPLIGTLLDGMREEQAAGNIHSRREALDWVEIQLQKGFITGKP